MHDWNKARVDKLTNATRQLARCTGRDSAALRFCTHADRKRRDRDGWNAATEQGRDDQLRKTRHTGVCECHASAQISLMGEMETRRSWNE
jgi:hypothetical protein